MNKIVNIYRSVVIPDDFSKKTLTVMGTSSLSVITRNGHKKLLHVSVIINIAATVTTGFERGNIIFINICIFVHPSIFAESTKLFGKD